MTNIELPSIDDYLDVASIHAYHTFFKHQSKEKRLRRIYVSSRDSARTPVQWTGEENAGFTTGKPWFFVNPNYPQVNAQAEEEDPQSILNFYRQCLALRKESDTLLWGSYREYFPRSRWLYMYEREWRGERILVVVSFSKKERRFHLPRGYTWEGAQLLLDDYGEEKEKSLLRPYEAKVIRWKG